MANGAIITGGASSWQIFQQENGCADIKIEGIWAYNPPYKYWPGEITGRVYVMARIVREDTAETVFNWTNSEEVGPNESWSITFRKVPQGGLYRIETQLALRLDNDGVAVIRGDILHHIGVGEVFVIAGQSNSAGYGRDPISDPPEMGVHLFRNSNIWDIATHPLNDSTASKHDANMEASNACHSPWLAFAKKVRKALNVPVGLIQTSLGGSGLWDWNPDEHATLYHNMMRIIEESGTVPSWVLWYQGCSDAGEGANTYVKRFENMVKSMRKTLNKEIGFFTIQLNRFVFEDSEPDDIYWGKVREAQRIAAKVIPDVYIVPATDLDLSDGIHNSSPANVKLGERVAQQAIPLITGGKPEKAPDLKRIKMTDDSSLSLEFDNMKGCLQFIDVRAKNLPFTVIDNEGKAAIASYEVCGNTLKLKLDRKLSGDITVHSMWQRDPSCYPPFDNVTYMPMLSFYNAKVEK